MNKLYVACDLGAENGRVMLGTLSRDQLMISEIRRFPNQPIREKDSLHWDIPQLYHETVLGLREISKYEEHIQSISCNSWAADYLLFDSSGELMTPTFHFADPRAVDGMKAVFAKVGPEKIYGQTGVHQSVDTTLFQLGGEKSKRLRKASQLLPVADGFNYLLGGAARVEMSSASATQLFNPLTGTWSQEMLNAVGVSAKLMPEIVPAGTPLGDLRKDVAEDAKLDGTRITAACSDALAAALVGLPVGNAETWAYLQLGRQSILGTVLSGPIISDGARELGFTNEMGFGGSVRFSKRGIGLRILDECNSYWKKTERDLSGEVLTHLAVCSDPFESLINPTDPRFAEPGDMPLKVQAFCKETNQTIPRKPGPIIRCVLESLALQYRKAFREMEALTGRQVQRLFILGDTSNSLLNNFVANALQIPVTFAPPEATAIGNVLVQALALRHIQSLEQARHIVQSSFKMETVIPHAAVWNTAFDRFTELVPGATTEQG